MSAAEFLLALGREMGRSSEEMEPYIDTLQENWVQTVEDLRLVPDGMLQKEWKFPFMLVHRLTEKLNAELSVDWAANKRFEVSR